MSSPNPQCSRNLRVNLNQDERVELGRQLAETTQQLAQINEDLSSVKKDFAARKSSAEAKVSDLSMKISNGYRIDPVKCEWRMDEPKPGKKTLIRLDTGETVETLDMIDADKQSDLPLADPEGGATVKTTVNSDPESGVVLVAADEEDEDND